MTPRILTLALAAALLTLAGCATQQGVAESSEAANQRIAGLEARLQAESKANQERIGALGNKVDALSGDLRRLQDSATTQASRQSALGEQAGKDAAAQQAAARTLATRLDSLEQRLQKLAGDTRLANEQAALRDQARETGQRLDRQVAQLNAQVTGKGLEQDANNEELADRLDALEEQLDELGEHLGEEQAKSGAAQTALAEKADSAGSRLDKSDQRLGELAAQAAALQAALPALRDQAGAAGTRLDAINARLDALEKRLDEAMHLAQDALDATGLGQRKIFGKVVESITLTEDKTLFPINSPELGSQDKAKLDALAIRLKALGTAYHLQIQGHTDGIGSDDQNYELGKARAEVVKNYLKEQGGIPLLRMSVMSYGALEAASRAGQSNRRIVVQVMQ